MKVGFAVGTRVGAKDGAGVGMTVGLCVGSGKIMSQASVEMVHKKLNKIQFSVKNFIVFFQYKTSAMLLVRRRVFLRTNSTMGPGHDI